MGSARHNHFNIIMKKLFLLVVAAMVSVTSVFARNPMQKAVNDGIVDITLSAPNTLRYALADLDVVSITGLVLHGELGSDDLAVIHSHTGRLSDMEMIDLSDVKLVADEGQYASFQTAKSNVGFGFTVNTYYLSDRDDRVVVSKETHLGGLEVYVSIYTTDLGGLFYGCTSLKKVLLPKGQKSIGDRTFTNCTALEELVLEDESKVTVVKDEAFKGCASLVNLCLSGLRTIGDNAFEGAQVGDIDLKNVTNVGERPFFYAKGLRKADFSSMASVPDHAFTGCADLKEVIWGDRLINVGDGAFNGCAIENVALPATIRRVYANAFDGTPWLEEQRKTVTEGIIYAGKVALQFAPKWEVEENTTLIIADGTTATSVGLCPDYSWHDRITRIVMPASMKYIGGTDDYNPPVSSCFAGLREVNLPEGLEYIGPNTFRHAQLLTVRVPSTVMEIGRMAFADMKKLLKVEYDAKGKITESSVFANCEALERVTFGADVTCVADYMFEGCASLIKVEFAKGEEQGSGIGSGRFCIGSGAFMDCTALTNFTFPLNLDSIGGDAFRNTGIIKAELPQGTRSIAWAFRNCARLTEVVLPESMECILDNETFYGTSLERIYDYHVTPLQIKDGDEFHVFRQLSNTATVYVMPGCMEKYKSDPVWRYFTIELMDEEHQATAIDAVKGSARYGNGAVYDLQGRRLVCPHLRSIIIKGGKKYFVNDAY